MKQMLKNWSIFKKLVLANILYSLPVMALIYLMVGAQNVNIDFGVQEKKGNAVQRPMEALLQPLLALRYTTPEQHAWATKAVGEQLNNLKKSLAEYGQDLSFNEAELKKRNRAQVEITAFESRLNDFMKKEATEDGKARLEKLNALVADVRTMITHAGDTSNLILDPDLDSYYLMDITLLALPQSQDRISEIREFFASRKELNAEDKIQIAVYAALAKQADLDRITGDLQTTLNEDPNFYGESEGLKSNLAPAIRDYQGHMEAFIGALTKLSTNSSAVSRTEFLKLADAAFESSFKSWNAGVDELDVLLNKRASTLTSQKYRSLAVAIAALLAAVAVLFWISSSFNSNMKQVIEVLRSAVTRTRNSGVELVELSDQLSTVSSDQASAVQQTSAAMHEIESMIQSTLQNSSTARATAETSHANASSTQEAVQNLSKAINEIAASNQQVLAQMDQSRKEMNEITKIISEIGGKTKMINDIVFQTKLLSFNASVEAARAGEAGKGFAVVAEEVGNLAQMSGNASREISDMLGTSVDRVNSISAETNEKVNKLVQASREKVDVGTRLADECNGSIALILSKIGEVLGNSDSIQTAAEEQAKGILEVSKAIHKLDEIAQKSMEMSERTASQSRDVSEQAGALESVVSMVQVVVLGKAEKKSASEDGPGPDLKLIEGGGSVANIFSKSA